MSIEEIETLRKKAKNQFLIGIVISIIIGLILFILVSSLPLIGIGVIIVGIIISVILGSITSNKFSLAFKNTFVLKALNSIFNNLVYEPEKGLDRAIIANTQMMNMGDRYRSNDFISGTYKNINFVQADVHIEEEHYTTDSNGNTTVTWITLFKGRWMVFDFNKVFKANIQVCQKGFSNATVNNFFAKVKYKKVNMEDQDFNNKFRVYAQDEHDAFYILTPSLMEKIKIVTTKSKAKLLFCFIDDKLHIGINNYKDSFEPSLFKKIDEEEILKIISDDIQVITNFVDELNLDNDLFKKGGAV